MKKSPMDRQRQSCVDQRVQCLSSYNQKNVHKGENITPNIFIQDLVYKRSGIIVLRTRMINVTVINTDMNGVKKEILTFVAECEVSQCKKGETIKLPRTLQPLPLPTSVWMDVSMDFITSFPKSHNKFVIMVVMDIISKYAHSCALPQPFTPTLVAQAFMDQIFKLHGMSTSIGFDASPTFTIKFWQELFKLQGVQLQLSTTYHPQTDGQKKVVNKCLETYLRCFTSEKKHYSVQWLPLAEQWYNTNYHEVTKMTPYEAVYGQLSPSPISYVPGSSKVKAVDQIIQNHVAMIAHLKYNLH